MNDRLSAARVIRLIRTKKSAFWERERERNALRLFHEASRRVPAYKDFLKKSRIHPEKIRTFKDFQLVPPVTKATYLQEYPFEDLLWEGSVRHRQVFSVTSGSTGMPFYFPRSEAVDFQSSVFHKLFLDYRPWHQKESTLVVVCFGMGAWVGGLITYQAFESIAREYGYPITLITPGPNKKEIFEALRNIGEKFEHIILCGYPPFLKDVIDEAPLHGIQWKKLRPRIIFAAEAFSEDFRDHIRKAVGISDPYRDIMNIYGSADLGTMSEETPLAILIRRTALKHQELYHRVFHKANRLPTLTQFHPGFVNFESVHGEIFCTGDNALPLVRYAIGDHGGVLSFDEVEKSFSKDGLSLQSEARRARITSTMSELPFVYVYERSDLSTKLYGATIYPEHVKRGTYHASVSKYLTGKFTMFTKSDRKHNEYLEINIELKPGVKITKEAKERVRRLINENLLKYNAEHRNNATLMGDRVSPRVAFWKHEHPVHFRPGGKQKWVAR